MDELLQEFVAETRETLEALAGEIVAWESDPADRARLDSIFRFVHTVKGSCGFLDLPRLGRLSHAAEDVLAAVRSGTRRPDKALVDGVLAIVDRIGELVEAIDSGASLDDSSEDHLIAALSERAAEPEAPAQPSVSAEDVAATRAQTRSVRLSVGLLDRMMNGMSEMVLARNELARRMRVDSLDPATEVALERLTGIVADMRDTVSRTRMQKIEALFSPLPRIVRDAASSLGKQVSLVIEGGDVELDREMIEMMRDPLVHMVRNAIDHGIETPEERRVAGKRETGRLVISARQSGNRILIEIADDGRGIDTDRLVAKLGRESPAREAALRALPERARLDLVFEPGLSSRDQVTAMSGRGVGMDVVRTNVEQIGGRIDLANRPGRGLVVGIEVPLTLAILSAVVVGAGDHRFAVPRQAIEEILSASGGSVRIQQVGDTRIVAVRDRRYAFVPLGELLGLETASAECTMIAIVDVPGGAFALGLDAIHDTEELVVKPAPPQVMAAGVYAGQTLPDSGLPMLLLDCAGIAKSAGLVFAAACEAEEEAEAAAPAPASALLVEDLDGAARLIAVDAVDRLERVSVGAISNLGGQLRIVDGDTTLVLVATGPLPDDGEITLVRLCHHDGAVAYVARAVVDIVPQAGPVSPVAAAGPVAGVTVIGGNATEILDPLWILGQRGPAAVGAKRPVCRLVGEDAGWMATFLGPVLRLAGYEVVGADAPSGSADVALAMEDAGAGPGPDQDDVPVVRLSRDRDHGVYCYDRAALVSAIESRIAGRG